MYSEDVKTYRFRNFLQVGRLAFYAMQDVFVLEVQSSAQDRFTTELGPLSIPREGICEYDVRIEEFHRPPNERLNR